MAEEEERLTIAETIEVFRAAKELCDRQADLIDALIWNNAELVGHLDPELVEELRQKYWRELIKGLDELGTDEPRN